ncbi:MAG: hypothetical protein ACXWE5_08705, partial [Actinomycetota bacterium]
PKVPFTGEVAEAIVIQDDGRIVLVGWSENADTGDLPAVAFKYLSIGEAGSRLGITRREYFATEDGQRPPDADQYEAICEFFGWPDARRVSV